MAVPWWTETGLEGSSRRMAKALIIIPATKKLTPTALYQMARITGFAGINHQ